MKKIIIWWFFGKPIRKYVNSKIKGKNEDFINYLQDLLHQDEIRMVGSREALNGYYDLDIEINRQLQNEIKKLCK